MDEKMLLIQVEDLHKGYPVPGRGGERLEIISGLDLALAPGETLAVVGASGIGKSTLLHILGALDRPDRGRVLYDGRDIFKMNNEGLARFRNEAIGFVFQFHHLLPEFTALENVMMPGLIRGMERKAVEEGADALLERVGLKNRRFHRVTDISGGEQQRVALARALVLKPRVLLADEPTGNLDRKNSRQVHDLLRELNREFGMAMVVVTHNMELAAYMSRSITLVKGDAAQAER